MASISPVNRNHSLSRVLPKTLLWSQDSTQIGCLTPKKIFVFSKSTGTPVSSFSHQLPKVKDRVNKLVLQSFVILIAYEKSIIVRTKEGLVREGRTNLEMQVGQIDDLFASENYVAARSQQTICIWSLTTWNPLIRVDCPQPIEHAFFFNQRLIVKCLELPYICSYATVQSDHNEEEEIPITASTPLFGNPTFYAYTADERARTYTVRSNSDLNLKMHFAERIIGIKLLGEFVVAIGEHSVTSYNTSSDQLQRKENEQEICGLHCDGRNFYIAYENRMTLLNPHNLGEEQLFSRKKCGEIQSLCRIDGFCLFEVQGKSEFWPGVKKNCCCSVM